MRSSAIRSPGAGRDRTIAWANAFIDDPQMFDSGEMQRAAEIEVGAAHKEVG